MKERKRIALITTWFAPNQGVATNRMNAFAQYLSEEFSVEVFTIASDTKTVKLAEHNTVFYLKSSSWKDLFKHKSTDSRWKHLFKTIVIVMLSKVSKSPLKIWRKRTLDKLVERHKQKAFDCIISSYAPHEAHQIALSFVKQYPDVKWVADMRDEMSKNPGISNNFRKLYLSIEQEVGEYASALTSVSTPILEDFKILCPNIPVYEEIRNGYNHEISPVKNQNSKFTIGYFGTFYGEIKPVYFFKALEIVADRNADFDFELHIIGASLNFEIPNKLKDKVIHGIAIPYLEAIERMMRMDVNLMVNPRTTRKGVYTGKLFDYLSAGKPILALVDKDDVAAKLINDCQIGYVAEFNDINEICLKIEIAFNDWKNNCQPEINQEDRQSFHRRIQVDKLKGLINNLIK